LQPDPLRGQVNANPLGRLNEIMAVKERVKIPAIWHLILGLLFISPPMLIGYAPLTEFALGLGVAVLVYLVWAASFLVWIPVFCWVVSKASMRDILLIALYPLVSAIFIFALEIVSFPDGNTVEFHLRAL
jgi:hypothetical protein